MEDIFNGNGLEVRLQSDDDFLKIKETLTRIGVASKSDKTLYQSCHILHKRGRYAVIHFKEMFKLDGKPSNFSETDERRRNTIAKLLEDWGLIYILDQSKMEGKTTSLSSIKIIPFRDKGDWNLVPKYSIGKKGR